MATQLGTTCSKLIRERKFGNMIGIQSEECVVVPLEKVAGKRKFVPLDHPLLESARTLGVNLGD